MVTCIVSGGQTGADFGGLLAGEELGIETGGWAPKGWRTEAGPAPWLETYGLVEWPDENYPPRTRANVELADGTVIFGFRSPGSNMTEEHCRVMGKPCQWVVFTDKTAWGPGKIKVAQSVLNLWLVKNRICTLNVAGNRESRNSGIEQWVREFLVGALR